MIPQEQQQPRMPPSRRGRFDLAFYQGYLFAFGVGGLVIEALFLLNQYKNIGLCVILYAFLRLLYPILVGYCAGTIWRESTKVQGISTSRFLWYISLLSTPLFIYEVLRLVTDRPMGSPSILFWIVSTVFMAIGVWLGHSSTKKPL
jgi:hypothetical protein